MKNLQKHIKIFNKSKLMEKVVNTPRVKAEGYITISEQLKDEQYNQHALNNLRFG